MSWTKLKSISPTRVTGVTLRITGKGYDGVPHVVIRIARLLAEKAGVAPHLKSRVDVMIGEGGDAGQMRIASNPNGNCGCHPQGKAGALKIAAAAPKPLPAEFETTAVEATVEDGGGITFTAPWYKKAADREVVDDDGVYCGPSIEDAIAHLAAPKTLDAVEEDARPALRPPLDGLTGSQAEVMERRLNEHKQFDEILADKPVNGSAKAHVYIDSFSDQAKIKFTHKNKSCLMTRRQHAFASVLQKAMQKAPPGSHMANDVLMKAIETKELSVLISTAIAVEGLVAPLGLVVGVIRKTGYWMKEG